MSETVDCSDPSDSILPQRTNPDLYEKSAQPSVFAGGQDGVQEFEAFSPEDVDTLCQDNPQDPLCYAQPIEGGGPGQGDAFGPPPDGDFAPGTQPAPGGFWGNAEKAEEFQNQSDRLRRIYLFQKYLRNFALY